MSSVITAGGQAHHESVPVRPGRRPRVVMVVANPGVSTTTGWPVGFWAAELFHPLHAFTAARYEVVIASPDGGRVDVDALSDPRDPSRWSEDDLLSMGALHTPAITALLDDTPAIGDVDLEAADALVVCGGQGPMFQFRGHEGLMAAIAAVYESGRMTAALCHGVAALIDVRLADGSYLVAGRTVTGFANVEEDFGDAAVGTRIMPYRVEDELRARGANYVQAGLFRAFAVRDGNLVTGQQQYSGARVAELLVAALGV